MATLVRIGNSGRGKTHAWVNGNTKCKARSIYVLKDGTTRSIVHGAGRGKPTCAHCLRAR